MTTQSQPTVRYFRLGYYSRFGRKSSIRVTFIDGRPDVASKRKLSAIAARQWGNINGQVTLFSPNRDGMLATWYSCYGDGGYVAVTDEPLEYAGIPLYQAASWRLEDHYHFYVYTFEEECEWAIFEYHNFDRLMQVIWQSERAGYYLLPAPLYDRLSDGRISRADEGAFQAFCEMRWERVLKSLRKWYPEHLPPDEAAMKTAA